MPSFMNAINNLNKIKLSSLHLLLPRACFESVGSAFENRLFLSHVTSKGYFLSLFVFNESPRTRNERKKKINQIPTCRWSGSARVLIR